MPPDAPTPTPAPTPAPPVPLDLDLRRNERLVVTWADGSTSTYPIAYLRQQCPCADCRKRRDAEAAQPAEPSARPLRSRLAVLPAGASAGPTVVRSASLVGNYALRLDWSDGHASGIYSFEYLREVAPRATA